MSHRSLFTYNITRPYPFKWFTPVTIISGLLLTGLLSWLNYAANGFDMVVAASSDPNVTVADVPVLRGLPKLLTGNFQPICQPTSLTINSKFFTSHYGLQYDIREIGKDWVSHTIPRFSQSLPALIYSNNVLEDCIIDSMSLEIESQDRTAAQLILSSFGILIRTHVFCNVSTPAGVVTVFLLSEWNNNPTTAESNFISPDKHSKASLWWGQSMLETYSNWLAHDMAKQTTCSGNEAVCEGVFRKARFVFSRPRNSSVDDILDPYFLAISRYFIYELPSTEFDTYTPDGHATRYASDYARDGKYPFDWWVPAEKLVKSMWSTLLADLGQSKPSNILLDDAKLQNFTSDFDEYKQHKVNVKRGPATHPYDPSAKLTGPLTTTPSVINTAYICNVPRRKSTGMLVWLILLADLVFLQLAWKTFKLAVDAWIDKKDEKAQHCLGCRLQEQEQHDALDEKKAGSDVSTTVAETSSQATLLSARTRSIIVGEVRRTRTM